MHGRNDRGLNDCDGKVRLQERPALFFAARLTFVQSGQAVGRMTGISNLQFHCSSALRRRLCRATCSQEEGEHYSCEMLICY